MVKDIALDIKTNDLLFVNGDLVFVENIAYVRQKLKVRLQWFLGEWFLNTDLGLPYFTEILTKNPNRVAIIDYFKKVILDTEGVESLEDFSFEFDNSKERSVKIIFLCNTSYGRISFNELFVVI